MVYLGYVSDTDGCRTLTVSASNKYRVSVYSKAYVNNVMISVFDGPDSTYGLREWVGTADKYPNQTHNIYPALDEFLANVAVGAYAMSRNNGGIAAYGLQYDASGTWGDYCNGSDQFEIKCASEYKYIASHETAHGVVRRRDNNQKPEYNFHAHTGDCTAWMDSTEQKDSKEEWFALEHASAALKEGFANFYSAWLFNDSSSPGAPCELLYRGGEGAQLNLDRGSYPGAIDLEYNDWYSCEGVPVGGLASWVGARNWLQELKFNTFCDEDLTGRGSVFDATRYFWDMRTDEGVSIGELIDLYDDMDPRNWAATKDEINLSRNPFCRLAAAAAASSPTSLTAAHDRQKDNGVDNGPCP